MLKESKMKFQWVNKDCTKKQQKEGANMMIVHFKFIYTELITAIRYLNFLLFYFSFFHESNCECQIVPDHSSYLWQ